MLSQVRKRMFLGLSLLIVGGGLLLGIGLLRARAATPEFVVAARSCPMAHCDAQMSDIMQDVTPPATAQELWRQAPNWYNVLGSRKGLGCSSNGEIAACTFYYSERRKAQFLRVYDAAGNIVWDTKKLTSQAFASAPLVSESGDVIVGDEVSMFRFNPNGSIAWQSPTGATPTSPVLTANGVVIAGTLEGPILAYDNTTGASLGTLTLNDWNGNSGVWSTNNTVAVNGNRIYIVMEFHDIVGAAPARLYALDIVPDGNGVDIVPAWYFEYRADSGASPLVIGNTIYFDGDGPDPMQSEETPLLFAIQDLGSNYALQWQVALENDMGASAARDPRGGLWYYTAASPWVRRVLEDGTLVQSININQLLNVEGNHVPTSAMSVAVNSNGHPILIFSATAVDYSVYVVALDVETETLLWQVNVGAEYRDVPFGQFPIVEDANGNPVVVFSTYASGVWGIGAP
ncbi:MAG: hypothetical protein Fur0021_17050 [Candidatus Promineifilaceae bacterium]